MPKATPSSKRPSSSRIHNIDNGPVAAPLAKSSARAGQNGSSNHGKRRGFVSDSPKAPERGRDWKAGDDSSESREDESYRDSMLSQETDDELVLDETVPPPREININAAPGVHGGGASMSRAFLSSYQLLDTITILIILLQVPPVVLTIVQVLFAVLTFVSPTLASPASNLHNFGDFFQGIDGNPSLPVVILMDVMFAVTAMFLWPSARGFVFDLSQAVIAITLGGGSAAGAIVKNTIVCCGLIAASQITRVGNSPTLSATPTLNMTSYPLSLLPGSSTTGSIRSSTGWIRNALAIHILAQGFTRAFRRWIAKQSIVSDPVKPGPEKRNSTEISKHPGPLTLNTAVADQHKSGDRSQKKKKKQGALIRSQQPLWAALASTKVHVIKEFEQSQTIFEGGAESTEKGGLGVSFIDEDGRIWITKIESFSVGFGATWIADDADNEADEASPSSPTFDVDRTKPFYVRVNGADWPSVRLHKLATKSPSMWQDEWTGEIYGLAPTSTYECKFLRSDDDSTVYSVTITTPTAQPAEDTATPVSASSPIVQPPPRVASPLTTLRSSISTAELKLHEDKARLKRTKKDHKSQLATLKKEVEAISSRVASSGSGDDRQRQKVRQTQQQIKQAYEAIDGLTAQIEEFDTNNEELKDWKRQKERYKKEKERLNASQGDFNDHKIAAKSQIDAVLSECASLQAKHDRLLAKKVRLAEHEERITNAHAQGLDEKERKAAEAVERERQRLIAEQNYAVMFNSLEQRIQDLRYRSSQAWKHIHMYETEVMQQQRTAQQMLSQQPTSGSGSGSMSRAFAGGNDSFGHGSNPSISSSIGARGSGNSHGKHLSGASIGAGNHGFGGHGASSSLSSFTPFSFPPVSAATTASALASAFNPVTPASGAAAANMMRATHSSSPEKAGSEGSGSGPGSMGLGGGNLSPGKDK